MGGWVGGIRGVGTARSRTSRRFSMLTHIIARNANQKRSGCANSFLSTTTCVYIMFVYVCVSCVCIYVCWVCICMYIYVWYGISCVWMYVC